MQLYFFQSIDGLIENNRLIKLNPRAILKLLIRSDSNISCIVHPGEVLFQQKEDNSIFCILSSIAAENGIFEMTNHLISTATFSKFFKNNNLSFERKCGFSSIYFEKELFFCQNEEYDPHFIHIRKMPKTTYIFHKKDSA